MTASIPLPPPPAVALRSAAPLTVYGCEPDEAEAFRAEAQRRGLRLRIVAGDLDEATAREASGPCVSVAHRSRVSAAALAVLASRGVRWVQTRSVGCDHVDLRAAAALGLTVRGVAYSPDAVADHALMLMLMALRRARWTMRAVDAHDFRVDPVRGRELRDATVGVVGTGRIGAAVVQRVSAFGARVVVHGRAGRIAAPHVGLDELLGMSDVVSLHVPLTPETRHLLSADRLALLRPDALVVNTGRGDLVDTAALVDALEQGRLCGAALDVLEGEDRVFYSDHGRAGAPDPLIGRLLAMPNVVITPHIAYRTQHALADVVGGTVADCIEHLGGGAR